jgi:hypothetical protein
LDKISKTQSCESNVIPKEFSANIIIKESPKKAKSVSFYPKLMIYFDYSQQSKRRVYLNQKVSLEYPNLNREYLYQ